MSYARRESVTLTTNSGAVTGYIPSGSKQRLTGAVLAIIYTKDDFADGVDFAITSEATGQSLWTDTNINAAETVYPLATGNLGATGAASVLIEVPIVIAEDRIKIVVTSGGTAKSGTFTAIVG